MKKVSLLLAVLLVMTCCMLAACGGDEETSSTETSSAGVSSTATSSEETSSAAATSSEETTTTESSVEDTTTVDDSSVDDTTTDDESTTDEPSAGYDGDVIENKDGANLALNKSYTGADPSTHDGVKHYNAKLTDGVAMDTISYDEGNWFAYYYNADAMGDQVNAPNQVGTLVLDLEAVYAVSTVKINTFVGNASGIVPPKSIKVECSADGTNYTTLAEKSFTTPTDTVSTIEFLEFKGDATIPAQYVRVTIELQGIFAFINEIEVY